MKRAEEFLARQLKKRDRLPVDNENQTNTANTANNNTEVKNFTFKSQYSNNNTQNNNISSDIKRTFINDPNLIVSSKKKSFFMILLAVIMIISGGLALLIIFTDPGDSKISNQNTANRIYDDSTKRVEGANKIQKSVVGVEVDIQETAVNGNRSFGTAFAVTDKDLITNRHVIDGRIKNTVRLYHPDWSDKKTALIKEIAINHDIAWLQLCPGEGSLEPISIYCGNTMMGENVYSLGYPGYSLSRSNGIPNITMDTGIIKATNRVINGENCFEMSATINAGNSGGPLLNASNQVIGVNTFGLNEYENCFFAIKIETIKLTFPALWEKMNLIYQR